MAVVGASPRSLNLTDASLTDGGPHCFQDLLQSLTSHLEELAGIARRLGEQHRHDVLSAGTTAAAVTLNQQQQQRPPPGSDFVDGRCTALASEAVDGAFLQQVADASEAAQAARVHTRGADQSPRSSTALALPRDGTALALPRDGGAAGPGMGKAESHAEPACSGAGPKLRELWTRRRHKYLRRCKHRDVAFLSSCDRLTSASRDSASQASAFALEGSGDIRSGATSDAAAPSSKPSSRRRRFSRRCSRHTRSMNALVIHPGSKGRLLWDVIGTVAVGYDLVHLPLEAFEPPSFQLFAAMAWLTTVFWTLDIVRTFFVGFHSQGRTEMRLSRIARRYLSSWFPLDLAVCSCDWAIIVSDAYGSHSDADNAGSLVRMGRAFRIMRMMRLLRLLKVHGMVTEMLEHVQSESFRIFLGIAKLIVFIMFVNHILACGFYWMGTLGSASGDTWIIENQLEGEAFAYQYTTALHWSLTQFTPASMEVVPRNILERTYTVCTVLFALVTFSSFVSSLTSAMTELRNLNSEKLEQCAVLRRYLRENRIDPSLTSRIWGWVEHKPNRPRRRTRAEDVVMLGTLPRRLQVELHSQVYGPVFVGHPFFRRFGLARPLELRFVFDCVHEVLVDNGHEMFATGQVATGMLFVASGTLSYSAGSIPCDSIWRPPSPRSQQHGSPGGDAQSPTMSPCSASRSLPTTSGDNDGDTVLCAGEWLCEAALWFEWKHLGQLTATADSELVGLKADKLQDIMACELQDMWEPGKYARLLGRHIEKTQMAITDIVFPDAHALAEFASLAFDDGSEAEAPEAAAPPRRMSLRRLRCSHWSLLSAGTMDMDGDAAGRHSSCGRAGEDYEVDGFGDVSNDADANAADTLQHFAPKASRIPAEREAVAAGREGHCRGGDGAGGDSGGDTDAGKGGAASFADDGLGHSLARASAASSAGGVGLGIGRRRSVRQRISGHRSSDNGVLGGIHMEDGWFSASCAASIVYGQSAPSRSSFSSVTTSDTSGSHSGRSSACAPMGAVEPRGRRSSVACFRSALANAFSSAPSRDAKAAAAAPEVSAAAGGGGGFGAAPRSSMLSAGARLSGALTMAPWSAHQPSASRMSAGNLDGGAGEPAKRFSLALTPSSTSSDSESSGQLRGPAQGRPARAGTESPGRGTHPMAPATSGT